MYQNHAPPTFTFVARNREEASTLYIFFNISKTFNPVQYIHRHRTFEHSLSTAIIVSARYYYYYFPLISLIT